MAPVTLYTSATPNGFEISILLEELGIDYEVRPIDLKAQEQKEEWFLKINPNGRIPALIDHENGEIPVFESGAMLIYLEENFGDGSFLPKGGKSRGDVFAWLMFQSSGVCPCLSNLNFLINVASESVPSAKKRFHDEGKRLISTVERQLSDGREYIVKWGYSIADIALFPWMMLSAFAGHDLDDYPHMKAWVKRLYAREAVKKGLDVPTEFAYKAVMEDEETMKATVKMTLEKLKD